MVQPTPPPKKTRIDTGYPVTDYAAMDAAPAPKDGPRPVKTKSIYPDITLRGDAASALIGMHSVGDTIKAEVEFKVVSMSTGSTNGGKYGAPVSPGGGPGNQARCELEIMAIHAEDDGAGSSSEADQEQSASDAVDAYRSGGANPAEEAEQD